MIRNPSVLVGAALTLMLASQAYGLTLINRDPVERGLEIIERGDQTTKYQLVISPYETLVKLCDAGCNLTLENGEEESFEGHEEVYIEDGHFYRVITD